MPYFWWVPTVNGHCDSVDVIQSWSFCYAYIFLLFFAAWMITSGDMDQLCLHLSWDADTMPMLSSLPMGKMGVESL